MVQLLLSEPTWNNAAHDDSVKQRIYLLNKLESVIWLLMVSGGRSEARLWLCNTIAGIDSISPHHQRELFVELLRSKPPKQGLAAQILQIIFEKHPHKAGHVIAKKSHVLENFFKGNPRRILQWFSNFSANGDSAHRKGAKALSHFAFLNRDICWEELVWKGKHGQSPAVVATKPHYFLDLDVEQTVENFVENVPEFWSSNEFSDSLRDGEILSIDTKFFVDFFVNLIYKKDSKEVWEILNEFLVEESFSSLCRHLLIFLEEHDLYVFLKSICKFLNSRRKSMNFGSPSYWLEMLLSKSSDFESIDQLLLLNAVISEGRQLLRLVREEEDEQAKVKINDIVSQICSSTSLDSNLAQIMEICIKQKTIESIKWLGLLSWVIHYRLSVECQTPESWELLFINNGISFRKSGKYPLLHQNECLEEMGLDLDGREVRARSKKKEKRRKRRRRDHDCDDYYGDALVDFDLSNDRMDLQSKPGNWLLSTDGYSTYWSNVDLPEHVSRHCFSTWMKWIFPKWGDAA